MDENLSITLRIGPQNYRFPIPREKEEAYRKAADMINDKIGQYMQHYPNQSTDQYLVVTMLDIAVKLVQGHMDNDASEAMAVMTQLSEEIDKIS